MAAKPEHDETKLPKWAQSELSRLRANEKYLRERIEAGPEDSDTFAAPYSDSPTPLGRGETVEFRVNPMSKVRVRIVRTHRGPVLDVNGDQAILVEPTASNAIRIRI